ncbi:unnamed protein product, partial [Ixodes persulcatus]
ESAQGGEQAAGEEDRRARRYYKENGGRYGGDEGKKTEDGEKAPAKEDEVSVEMVEEPPAKRKIPDGSRFRRPEENQDRRQEFKSLSARVDKLQEKVDSLDNRLTSMENRFMDMFTKITERLDTLASLIPAQQWQPR